MPKTEPPRHLWINWKKRFPFGLNEILFNISLYDTFMTFEEKKARLND